MNLHNCIYLFFQGGDDNGKQPLERDPLAVVAAEMEKNPDKNLDDVDLFGNEDDDQGNYYTQIFLVRIVLILIAAANCFIWSGSSFIWGCSCICYLRRFSYSVLKNISQLVTSYIFLSKQVMKVKFSQGIYIKYHNVTYFNH